MADRPPKVTCCRVCGYAGKSKTGECSNCGAYECATCNKLHYGDASQACPGGGVPIPR